MSLRAEARAGGQQARRALGAAQWHAQAAAGAGGRHEHAQRTFRPQSAEEGGPHEGDAPG